MMKRLRVLLVCLVVALLCWYPSQNVCCSEQSLLGSAQPAQDKKPDSESEQDSARNKVSENCATHSSYDTELETEKATQENQAALHHEQTVNQVEAAGEEAKFNAEHGGGPVSFEPTPNPQINLELQTCTKENDQDVLVPSPTEAPPPQGHRSAEAPVPAESSSDSLHPNPVLVSTASQDEAEHIPTSKSASPITTGAVRVASAGDELPADSFVCGEHSDSQCRVIPPKLATCESPPCGHSVLSVEETDLEEKLPSQSDSPDPEAGLQSKPGPPELDQKPQELQDGFTKLQYKGNKSHHHEEQGAEANPPKEPDPQVPGKEDIPTFDEWKKQVMEVEKEKSQTLHTSTSSGSHPVKKSQKNFKNNYASVECGAKILSANSEAKSTSAILMENMDLYMLNPCSNKIWFVIELCEPIQVKQLDIANFELFSSTPKDFLVSISDRYPTNKWVKLGTFHARDERIVQSFPLDEQLYAKFVKMFIKYIKVELLSHFGSEHFCPLSLIRVFGTSMVEEYEEIADSQYPSERPEYLDEDYDYPPGYQPSEDKTSKNLLGSATNAIFDMVSNIAANVLGGKPRPEGGAEREGNVTAEGSAKEVTNPAATALHESTVPESTNSEQSAAQEGSHASMDSSSSEAEKVRQIVTLVEEEEDEEEPRQSTVTLMKEDTEEEETNQEKIRQEADGKEWESQTFCPPFFLAPPPSPSLCCSATLPELLLHCCSARIARERVRSLKRRGVRPQTRVNMHIPPLIIASVPTPSLEPLPLTEKAPESEDSVRIDTEGGTVVETPSTDDHPRTLPPKAPTAEPPILEPSRTSSIPPHTFTDVSLTRPTPEKTASPSRKDASRVAVATPPLQAGSILESQQASSTAPIPSVSSAPLSSETPAGAAVSAVSEQPALLLPTAARPEDLQTPPTDLTASLTPSDGHPEPLSSAADTGGDMHRQSTKAPQVHVEGDLLPQSEDGMEEELLSPGAGSNTQRGATDFYAELQNAGDYSGGAASGNGVLLNGGAVHGSSQKESVFMRLNNRIKALEMNMSLSSRYLEELSQRYRKQMEEMQRAFNKTITKLQNTSRIAAEQDQKQTDSIQVLQTQLENITKLMLNLSATVSQLQTEVSDRQSYLVVSLVLCLLLGLLLCLQCCRSSTPSSPTNAAAHPKSNNYPSPKRCFSSYDDMSLKRRVTCPLVRSKSFQLPSSEVGPDDLYIVEPLRFSPEKKRKRCKTKSLDKVETLKAFDPSAVLANGGPKCDGFNQCLPPSPPPFLPPPPLPLPTPPAEEVSLLPPCRPNEFLTETSSCGSSTHSEESYTSRLPPPSPTFPSAGLCNGHTLTFPPSQSSAKSRQEKRSMKRRKSRQTELQFPHMPGRGALPALQQLMKGNKEMSVGTIQMTVVSGRV
ncbi:SUN domain-containing ossification factor [Oryzias melastigma]|uniref:SUN domain-containing ossification factor n=1 Tax=Oryzias melastigma TaxID=30732 RepID=A0A834FQA9_ORYME|nr:SUN domain-containing ossification factor [Oryzias melastigma]